MRSVVALVNVGSGRHGDDCEALRQRIESLFRDENVAAEVRLVRGDELEPVLREIIAAPPDVVAAGGGDGTISSVAGLLAGTGIALGVLPLGTLNHFAKDMQLPLALEAAVALIARGPIRSVDVGEVNGRVFVNNSSLGLYPDAVRERKRQQRRLGRGKWVALAWASLGLLRRYRSMNVRLLTENQALHRRTPFVFIGNNAYTMQGFAIGQRERLDGGRLSVYVAQRPGRLRLFQLMLRALFGRLDQARDFDVLFATELIVESRRRHLRVATDGEVGLMTPPLRYRILPGRLRVVADDLSQAFPS